jgi:hypothetical protein
MSDESILALFRPKLLCVTSSHRCTGTYRHFEELRRHPNGLVFWKTILDIIFATTLIVEAGLRLAGLGSMVQCRTVAFLVEFSLLGSEMMFFMLSVDLFTALRNPFVDYKSNMKMYLFSVFVAAGSLGGALVGPSTNVYGLTDFGTCWVRPENGGMLWAYFYAYLILIYVWSFFVLMYARRRLRKGLRDTYEARMLSFRHGVAFVSGFAVFWLVVAAVYWGTLAFQTAPNLSPVAWAFCLLFTSRGVPTMVVWLANHDLRAVARSEAAARFKYGGTLGRVNRQLQPHLNLALRKEVLHYTTLAIRMSVMHAAGEASVLRAFASVKQQLQQQRDARPDSSDAGSNQRRSTFLRRVSTVFGVGAGARPSASSGSNTTPVANAFGRGNPLFAAQHGLQQEQRIAHNQLPLNEPDDGTVPAALAAFFTPYSDNRPDAKLGFDWVPLQIALNAHLFERGGVLDVGDLFGRSPPQRRRSQQFGGNGGPGVAGRSGRSLFIHSATEIGAGGAPEPEPVVETPSSAYDGVIKRPPLVLQDLAPAAFARIRNAFGISPAQFLYSLSRTTKESFSEGASGAFM